MDALVFQVFNYKMALQCRFIVLGAEALDEALALPQDPGARETQFRFAQDRLAGEVSVFVDQYGREHGPPKVFAGVRAPVGALLRNPQAVS
jgi:hypothetical protein